MASAARLAGFPFGPGFRLQAGVLLFFPQFLLPLPALARGLETVGRRGGAEVLNEGSQSEPHGPAPGGAGFAPGAGRGLEAGRHDPSEAGTKDGGISAG